MSTLSSLSQTSILNPDSKLRFSRLITKEFAKTTISNERANQLLLLAYQFDIPELEEMMSQFNFNNQINTLLCKQ